MSPETTAGLSDLVGEWLRVDQVRANDMLAYLDAKVRHGH
jgi:hypothetical protein